MLEIDWNAIIKDVFHSSPLTACLVWLAHRFMTKHQNTSDRIQKSVETMQLSLAAADLPKMKSDLETVKERAIRVEAQLVRLNPAFKGSGL